MMTSLRTIMRRLAAVLLVGLASVASAEDPRRPAVIALYGSEYFQPYGRRGEFTRDALITELIKNYDCRVVGRARPYSFAVEGAISSLGAIGRTNVTNVPPLAADYCIVSSFYQTPTGTVITLMDYHDLKSSSDKQTRDRTEIRCGSSDEFPRAAAAYMAAVLKLNPASSPVTNTASPRDLKRVWAVLPFARYDLSREVRTVSVENDITPLIEKDMQGQDSIGPLVDRQNIDKVLDELKVASISDVRESEAGVLARLVGADLVVMGSVSPHSSGLRVDVHIVDARQALVISADSAICGNKGELGGTVGALAKRLASSLPPVPELRVSGKEERYHEADLCLEMTRDAEGNTPERAFTFWTAVPHLMLFKAMAVLNGAETAYLLAGDDTAWVYRSVWNMRYFLVKGACSEAARIGDPFDFPAEISGRAAYLMDRILTSFPENPGRLVARRTPGDPAPWVAEQAMPLLLRAEALLHMKRYAEAWKLTERHLARYPDNNPRWALLLQVQVLFAEGRLDTAKSLLEDILKKYPHDNCYLHPIRTDRLLLDISKARKDDRTQYEVLRRDYGGNDADLLFALMQKFEGPQKTLEYIGEVVAKDPNGGSYCRTRASLLFSEAKCLAALGRKREAADACLRILASSKESRFESADFDAQVGRLLEEIGRETGIVTNTWVRAADVRPFPEDMSVNVYQLGDDSRGLVTKAARVFGSFLGTDVQLHRIDVAPPVFTNVPDGRNYANAVLWHMAENRYLSREYRARWQQVAPLAKHGSDSLLDIFAQTIDGLHAGIPAYGTEQGNPCLLTIYVRLYTRDNDDYAAVKELAASMIHSFRHAYSSRSSGKRYPERVPLCPNFPCVFSGACNGAIHGMNDKVLLLCPACQEEYRKADLAKVKAALQDHMQGDGGRCDAQDLHRGEF